MKIDFLYNGNKIDIEFSRCRMIDRFGGLLDNIEISIPTNHESELSSLGVKKCDEINISTDSYSSGIMYVDNFGSPSGSLSINAISLNPSSKDEKSRIWRNVSLHEILYDISKSLSLALKLYEINDYVYESICQIRETDLQFLQRIMLREGYSIKIDNNCLIAFNEFYIEHIEPTTIRINDVNDDYFFSKSDKCVHKVTVVSYDIEKGLIEHSETDESIIGKSTKITEKVNSLNEAERFSKGYLRNFNKNSITGDINMSYNPNISAGSTLKLEGFNEYDEIYVVYEIIHDVKNEKTSLKIRKILEY